MSLHPLKVPPKQCWTSERPGEQIAGGPAPGGRELGGVLLECTPRPSSMEPHGKSREGPRVFFLFSFGLHGVSGGSTWPDKTLETPPETFSDPMVLVLFLGFGIPFPCFLVGGGGFKRISHQPRATSHQPQGISLGLGLGAASAAAGAALGAGLAGSLGLADLRREVDLGLDLGPEGGEGVGGGKGLGVVV